ncbi:hypothetical protein GCM10010862_36830 [Devosia nitrariae]|uniref:Major facilitator superfamily (MFS) profile domain-containing protein n=1 Tax=Devosia nitrariae TaxID=2071872 RepID=A0ABQ5W8J2_9HYPH|nr:MFS transporter [Devosia nitrariae]GLQ56424.1 hypothetical protein GCM10010862_36830 [Devosia nitrariae]
MNDISCERARGWVLSLVALASFIVALDAMVMSTALTKIQASLGATLHQLEWSVNGYNLSFAVLLTIGAALGERFGRKRFFVLGLTIFLLASVGCALSQDIGMLIAARVIQSAGAALIMPLGLAILGAAYPGKSAERRWASSVRSPALPCSVALLSAARSRKVSTGRGSSGSTCQ